MLLGPLSRSGTLKRVAKGVPLPPDERSLAGTVSACFYIVGGVTLLALLVLPGVPHGHRLVLLGLALVACAWGVASLLLIGWEGKPRALLHISGLVALAMIAVAVASSGGAQSPAWIYLFFIPVFAAYFFPPRVAIAYFAATAATQALVLLYDPRAGHGVFVAELVIASAAYFAIGGAIIAGKALLASFRLRAERLAAEQSALSRLATAAIEAETPERIYELVARETAGLIGAAAATILRLDSDSQATVMGSWADGAGTRDPPGTVVEVRPGSDTARARDENAPVRTDSPLAAAGYASSIVAPVGLGDRTWGVLAVTAPEPVHLTARDEQELTALGNLLATAIASIEERAKLFAQASTDPLTGVANHRTLQERLEAEVSRAQRHEAPLAVALIDIDHFKQVNDFGGHEAGDELLVRVAGCLADQARAEDTLGRIGGDEFAWLMPETTREQALVAVERARRLIAATASRQYRITVSGGICDTNATRDPAELISFADAALYWSKAHGRNLCWIYDPSSISELSARERVERLERSSALLGLRALARAIDAHDPAMSRHSDRVAALASKLARAAGWSPERAVLLSEAALVHDVGKVGVRRDLLYKSGALSRAEREQVKAHAELTARITEGVLTPEQVEWIRSHHERPDGRGYPRGLTASGVPEGAALLAVADAWDAMTTGRPGQQPKSVDTALAECATLVGSQFTRTAVGALLKLHASGELDLTDLAALRDTVPPGAD